MVSGRFYNRVSSEQMLFARRFLRKASVRSRDFSQFLEYVFEGEKTHKRLHERNFKLSRDSSQKRQCGVVSLRYEGTLIVSPVSSHLPTSRETFGRTEREVGRSLSLLFRNFYFSLVLNYISLIMLLQCLELSPMLPSTQHPPLPQQTPHHYSCPWVMHICSLATPFPVLYFTPRGHYITTNLNFLIPSPLRPFPHIRLPSGNHQNSLHIHDSVCSSCLLSLFLRFNC